VTQPLGEIRVVDDRVFLLGLAPLYREAMTSLESLAQEGASAAWVGSNRSWRRVAIGWPNALSPQAPE
jgi:hypothetical protein